MKFFVDICCGLKAIRSVLFLVFGVTKKEKKDKDMKKMDKLKRKNMKKTDDEESSSSDEDSSDSEGINLDVFLIGFVHTLRISHIEHQICLDTNKTDFLSTQRNKYKMATRVC